MDFRLTFGDFSTTQITVDALSAAGRAFFAEMFGAGATSITMPKSRGEDFAEFVGRKGLTWEVAA